LELSKAFDKTLKDFEISARSLSEQSGVGEKMISQFRNSRQRIYSDTLEKLLEALPFEVKLRFFSLLLGEEITPERLVVGMGEAELSSLLLAIADQIYPKKTQKSAISIEEKVAS
jgi:transcriptional regulator with XRE-family HTH domain